VADLKIGILGEVNRNSANDSEREAFSASRKSAFLKGYSHSRSSAKSRTRCSKRCVVSGGERSIASAVCIVLIRLLSHDRIIGIKSPTLADLKREANHERPSGPFLLSVRG
jgi:hypothetical protein